MKQWGGAELRSGRFKTRDRLFQVWTRITFQLAVEAFQTGSCAATGQASVGTRSETDVAFGAQFVRDEPNLDRRLVELVIKIEDVYRRWYRQLGNEWTSPAHNKQHVGRKPNGVPPNGYAMKRCEVSGRLTRDRYDVLAFKLRMRRIALHASGLYDRA